MSEKIRFAVRDWDYVTPLLLGDIKSDTLQIDIERVNTLPDDFMSAGYDACEVSFSRYAQARARGEQNVVAVPNFLMRGFRHRCVIVNKNSSSKSFADLKGKNIGVTGWQDSGNIWTRAALANGGPKIEEAFWYAGRLTEAHPIEDRLGKFAEKDRIMAMPKEQPLMDALSDGFLDAVCTPFMPQGFFDSESAYRHLISDFRAAESAYYKLVGYVPGIHVLAFNARLITQKPWIAQELSHLLDKAQNVWLEKRRKYAETTPWIIDDLGYSACVLAPEWNKSGLENNRKMITDFLAQMFAQGIIDNAVKPEDVFPVVAD